MRSLVRRSICSAALCLLGVCALGAQEWKIAESFPGVDFSKLTAAQKQTALKLIRSQGCSCGCNMKLAECRIVDPSCSYSNGLVAAIVDTLAQGKSEKEALAAAADSKWAHLQEPSQHKLLDSPVAIPVAGSPVTGPEKAPITIVEFSDFQCPYCAEAFPEIAQLLKNYPSQVKLIFKQYPLDFHPQADLAAAAAIAAHKQGKFWVMHDALFSNHNDLSRKHILALAQKNGLDMKRFEDDLDSTAVRETVVRDVQDGDRAGVEGTPTIFINGQRYNGPIVVAQLKPVLDAELNSGKGQTASAR